MGQTQEAEIQLGMKMQIEIFKNQNKGRKLPRDAKTSLNSPRQICPKVLMCKKLIISAICFNQHSI